MKTAKQLKAVAETTRKTKLAALISTIATQCELVAAKGDAFYETPLPRWAEPEVSGSFVRKGYEVSNPQVGFVRIRWSE